MLTSSPSQELSNINNNTGINKVLYTTHDIINNHHSIQDNIENSASTVSDTVDDIVIVAYPEYKEDVRQLLIQHSDNCDECIQSPLEETHYFNDSPNLVLQSYPKRYIIAADGADNINYEGKTYHKAGFTKYPTTSSL